MMGVVRILLARLAQAGFVAVLVGTVGFALMHSLPGDPAFRIAAERYGPDMVDAAAAEAVRAELGLDGPVLPRLLRWLGRVITLNLGHSLVSGAPVLPELLDHLAHTAMLAAMALALALPLGLPLGVLAGLRPGGAVDRVVLLGAVLLRAVPPYALGLALMVVFALHLGWLPPAGFESPAAILLPALTLALGVAALGGRVARDAVMAVEASPFLRFARWKGLSEAAVVRRHGLRNASIPVVAVLGLQFAALLEGAVVVESLFSWPGLGHALVHAIFARDVPMVQGAALALGLGFVLLNALADALAALLDPRRARGTL
ncbi:ABC transporter permease [Sabulicella glaciei]|uniref:ABC transporter permease n=1 Tax=Sabulicella glaciei TaxID=2984948 RepID=A0ABT3NPD8_9PROT|nr:ABC transporter permease [Roseococcus sp. MDT2-1-1]MCW8084022.1 ABC transporter permease [Roseococcus sp. MDT2-1-1]